ncbi:hypothetical protein A3K73_01555 [Candidatus Pacearchaeota archaeon RBG_13_36_9]|nr:MAG: hypothetical protein A3K73_01555 [Candidatus Pacearchaeota archaeon RBG_13_36_9]
MSYWKEKEKYERFKAQSINSEAHLSERERERKRVYESELSKLGGKDVSGLVISIIIIFFGLALFSSIYTALIGIGLLIWGFIKIFKVGSKNKERQRLAWEKAAKRIPYKHGKRD